MNIENLLKLLNDNNLQKLKHELEMELLKSNTTKAKFNIIKSVETYLRKTDKTRPVLKTVMEQPNGTVAILDGFTGAIYNSKITIDTLKSQLPTTDAANSINLQNILNANNLNNAKEYIPSKEEEVLLTHLKQYKSICKAAAIDKKDMTAIKLFNRYFDIDVLIKGLSICGKLEDLEFLTTDKITEPLFITNKQEQITGIILPLRPTSVIVAITEQITSETLGKLKESMQ